MPGPDFPFSLFPVFFVVIFCLIAGVILFAVIRGIRTWSRNNAQPVVPAEARVVSRRADVSHYDHYNGDTSQMHTYSSSTTYFATFEFTNGQRLELRLPEREYGLLAEGDRGVLTFQGTRFIGFERRV